MFGALILKAARDHSGFGDDTVVVTGSNWRTKDDVTGNLLAGRAGSGVRRVRHLLPLSFREYMEVVGKGLPLPSLADPSLLQTEEVRADLEALRFDIDNYDLAWQTYLTCGGFPRAIAEHHQTGEISTGYLRDIQAWLQRDVEPDAAPQSLLLLLDTIVKTMSSPLSIRSTAEELEAERREIGTRLNLLVGSYAALWCPQHNTSGTAVENAQMKLYLLDPVLAQLPSRLRAGLHSPDMTVLSEAALGVTLARAIDRLEEGRLITGDTIGYVRTSTGNEIDFGPVTVPGPAGPRSTAPMESKWVDDGWRNAAKVLEGKYGHGVLATKSILDFGHQVWAIPAPLVALLLG